MSAVANGRNVAEKSNGKRLETSAAIICGGVPNDLFRERDWTNVRVARDVSLCEKQRGKYRVPRLDKPSQRVQRKREESSSLVLE
jgi:hypothetical protein